MPMRVLPATQIKEIPKEEHFLESTGNCQPKLVMQLVSKMLDVPF